ncbi:hypothetical protein CS0771_65230 [Catellatospora sp. IY07-71]|nr:hypothetical protein CS0771_65230 [Catellatospora sp. IY07-71]
MLLRRVLLCVTLVLAGVGLNVAPAQAAPDFSVLIFSKTAGFRHDSIPVGITAIQQLGTANNFAVEATEDATQFNDANLARFKAVIWLSTTGDVLDATQQAAFERYVRAGGGYVGVHAASDTEYDWAWYGNLVGAYFASHPAIQQVTVRVEDTAHPSTAGIPASWVRTDELYNYRTNPRAQVHVLANLDESTYTGGSMGADHPISWCRAYDGGRSWYTGLGHTQASFSETHFRTHLLGGIRYAAQGTGSCTVGTPPAGTFSQVTLAKGVAEVGEPMGLTVLPNRGVLHTSRDGVVRYTDVNGNTKVAMTLQVYTHDEEGLQSIKADPNFATNRWVYMYYAPPLSTPGGDAPATGTAAQFAPFNGSNKLGRFTVRDDHTIDPASLVTILDVPTSRGSAATSAVTSTSTRPATCTCPPATTRTRSTRAAPRRSTSGPTATRRSMRSAPRATATTCAARCCGSSRARPAATPSRPATCSRRARPTPGPRCTPWASATRSG